jgi:pimeloyl-ACP methyl ester carboxylesterase
MNLAGEAQHNSFVLLPGAGGMAWYWHRVLPLLEQAHCERIAIDLPSDDASAGLTDYADVVVRAIDKRTNVILVAQSLGGFTAPLVCARAPVQILVFVNAMIPQPGEAAGNWWDNTGAVRARVTAASRAGYSVEFDPMTYCLHDVPEEVLRAGPVRQRDQAERIFEDPCRFQRWPQIPIHVIASADDRFFPLEFQRAVARARLEKNVEVVPGGHLVALSHPQEQRGAGARARPPARLNEYLPIRCHLH